QHGDLADLETGLTDRGKRRVGIDREIGVIKADDRNIIRDAETAIGKPFHGTECRIIIGAEDCRRRLALTHQPVGRIHSAAEIEIAIVDERIVEWETGIAKRSAISLKSVGCHRSVRSAPKMSDAAM